MPRTQPRQMHDTARRTTRAARPRFAIVAAGAAALALIVASAGLAAPPPRPGAKPAGLFEGMGDHHRIIATTSKAAQRYFDQGLTFVYSFNHDEAIRSFERATELDPACAIAWWGIALANGPHINNPAMDEAHSKAAWEAYVKARALAPRGTDTERALIAALGARYAVEPPADRKPFDLAYAGAMRGVWREFPKDADVGALFAEALMDLRPWDLWTQDGKPQPGTGEVLATLEAVLRLDPDHPLANHLYIHAVEASPEPERAVPSAERLGTLVPSAGHMVHMPAHIYSRVGRWADASEANVRAVAADRAYRRISPQQNFYRIYMAHNHHFLSWASMMEGRSAVAIRAAREMIAGVPADFAKAAAAGVDGYMTIAVEANMRFGRWEEILSEPPPPDYLPITAAHRHFARGVAFAATHRVEEAKAERRAFEEAGAKVTAEMVVGNNPARTVLAIAARVLDGEIAYREGRIDEAVAALREGVRIEDGLRYNEAPDWIQPVRHTLGGVLLEAGRAEEAEAVYRADLVKNIENGWALFGLAKCLRARNAGAEAKRVEDRFAKAWKRADVPLTATCFCLTKE